jgi:ubiquinone/menaquinone biosynthesis C-methylase UbiE
MAISRDVTNKINWILDNLLPPIMRDSKLVMYPLFKLLFKDKAHLFVEFKEKAPFMSKDEYKKYYEVLEGSHLQRETNLNKKCFEKILASVEGESVADIGCYNTFLLEGIKKQHSIKATGVDLLFENNSTKNDITLLQGDVENIPLKDKSIDTVICTHTIEHVQDPIHAIAELRRVTRKKLIVVVPRQRPSKYTFDLHLNFFPYTFSLQKLMKNKDAECMIIDNDIYYCETIK